MRATSVAGGLWAALAVGGLWAAFVLCWLILAQFNKEASRSSPLRSARGLRAVVLAVVLGAVLLIVLLRRRGAPGIFTFNGGPLPLHAGIAGQWVGVGLCLVGFAFAFWARVHIGRNWGLPMSLRRDHELVTSGPYAYVRHPIYTGLMLALIGSGLAVLLIWLLLFPLYFGYFIFSARTEEKMMLAQFPDAYPAYRGRTKMLIPFVF